MDLIIEFILEILFEGAFEAGTSSKLPKWIRYPLLTIIILFYALLIIGFLIIGIKTLPEKPLGGIIILIIDFLLLIMTIFAFRKKLKEIKK